MNHSYRRHGDTTFLHSFLRPVPGALCSVQKLIFIWMPSAALLFPHPQCLECVWSRFLCSVGIVKFSCTQKHLEMWKSQCTSFSSGNRILLVWRWLGQWLRLVQVTKMVIYVLCLHFLFPSLFSLPLSPFLFPILPSPTSLSSLIASPLPDDPARVPFVSHCNILLPVYFPHPDISH